MKKVNVNWIVAASAVAACVAAVAIPRMSVSGQSAAEEVKVKAADPQNLAPAHPVRLATHAVDSGGLMRAYAVYVPDSLDGERPTPVVLDIHGTGSNPAQELSISGLAAAAEARGFIVLLPVAVVPHPGGGASWNVPPDPQLPDDERYLLDLLDDASRRYELDSSRVYVTGFSGGARLGSEFASRHADRIAALAVVGGLRAPAVDGPPVPVIAFHGTGDPINPYSGGGPVYWGYGVERALSSWTERDRCGEEDVEANVAPFVWKRTWRKCDGAAEVTLYRFDGGHVWPGSSFAFPVERFGVMPHDIDATTVIFEFFERYGFPEALPRRRVTSAEVTRFEPRKRPSSSRAALAARSSLNKRRRHRPGA